MDSYVWEPDDYLDDPATEWEDPEALPFGMRRTPPRSAALARRLFPMRPVSASRLPVRQAPATVVERVRDLDHRQRVAATQLAMMQQRTTTQQSAEHFGPFATSAVGALALGFKNGDLFGPSVTHGLPLLQLLLSSRGQAMTSSFKASPWSTLGFPALALFLTAFRESIPGLRPTVVDEPDVIVTEGADRRLLVTARKPKGASLRVTGPSASPADPDSNSAEFPSVMRLLPGQAVKVRAFIGTAASTVVLVAHPEPAAPGQRR